MVALKVMIPLSIFEDFIDSLPSYFGFPSKIDVTTRMQFGVTRERYDRSAVTGFHECQGEISTVPFDPLLSPVNSRQLSPKCKEDQYA